MLNRRVEHHMLMAVPYRYMHILIWNIAYVAVNDVAK